MTKVEFKKASGPLSEYAEKARKDPIIVIKRGKPFAAVVPIRNADEETVALSTNRKFLKIIDRSKARAKKRAVFRRAIYGAALVSRSRSFLSTFSEFPTRGNSHRSPIYLKRLERSEAVERLERLERAAVFVSD
jgi:antitoxin (DNA-binding transcriptional repressor) of toxin-antitoxin stability system